MKKIPTFFLALMFVTLSLCPGLAEGALDGIRTRGVIRVGATGDYNPMNYLDPETGRYVGFDAELAEDLAAEKESGRIDELAEEYIYRYIESEEALQPAA